MAYVGRHSSTMSIDEAAKRLIEYIKSLPDFVYHTCADPYGHMGATVADCVLQANNKYKSHVEPRIKRIFAMWPKEKTVSEVLALLESVSPTNYLNWQGEDRCSRFVNVLRLLKQEGVEDESSAKIWIDRPGSLEELDAISGVGDKTVDYFRIMVGLQGVAIDRRLLGFLSNAEILINQSDYRAARDIVNRTADLACVPRRDFDHSLWRYMDDHEKKACA